MKNLNFLELNAQELEEVNGGIFGWIVAGIIAVATVADAIWDIDWLDTPADAFR
jgi:lactobin A/cerein 7B family class IIb bacteriocin